MGRQKTVAPCSVDGCESPKIKNGYCNAHNLRFRRYGDPLAPKKRAENCSSDEERKARRKAAKHAHYLKNKALYAARSRRWRENNPEAVAESRARYRQNEESAKRLRAARKAWRERNSAYERKRHAAYKAANRDKVRSYRAIRRASILQAKPPWLTKEQKREIAAVYREAIRLSEETGVLHHVDHIVPLRGGTVCGLHVPWNLRAIPAHENQRRPRVWRGEEQDAKDTSVATQGRQEPGGRPEREGQSLLQQG
jgi:hypothetical protein